MIIKSIAGLKFENIDLFSVMGSIVDSHVKHYKTDFDIDKSILRKAAGKESGEERSYIWLCRSMGTWLLREREVFINDTRESNTFRFYAEQTYDNILAYAVKVTGVDGSTVIGNLYTLDYLEHYIHVAKAAQKTRSILFVYENGQIEKPSYSPLYGYDDDVYGKFQYIKFQPEDSYKLSLILDEESRILSEFKAGNLFQYLQTVRDIHNA